MGVLPGRGREGRVLLRPSLLTSPCLCQVVLGDQRMSEGHCVNVPVRSILTLGFVCQIQHTDQHNSAGLIYSCLQ